MSLMSLTAVELGRKIKEKEVTVEEAVTAALDAIEKREAEVHSFVTVDMIPYPAGKNRESELREHSYMTVR